MLKNEFQSMIEQYSNELMNISRQSGDDIPANAQPEQSDDVQPTASVPVSEMQTPSQPVQTQPQKLPAVSAVQQPTANQPQQFNRQPQDIPDNPNRPPQPATPSVPSVPRQPRPQPMPQPNNMEQIKDDSANMTYEQFLSQNPGIGALRVQVFSGQQAIPIPNAEVVVTKDFSDGQQVFFDGVTDISGIVDNIELPAPSREISESPQPRGDGVRLLLPYSQYNVMVTEARHRPQEYTNVPIFDGIKSIQPVRMTPVQFANGGNEIIVYPEMEPNDL